ncbi:hypothetical protein V2G26_014453 [Clonostachys chloroleuca]
MVKLPMLPALPLRVLILSALSASLVSAVPANLLFARQSTCPTNAFRCENSSFCCSNGNTCISLAGNTTVLCCPKDSTSNCSKIQTITCNVDSLNSKDNPDAPVKTTVFDVSLPKCGDMCCPFGYSCSAEGSECVKDQDQSQPPKGHSTTTSASTSTKTSSTTRSTSAPTTQPSTTGASTTGGSATGGSATSTQVPTASATNDEAAGGKDKTHGPDIAAIVGGFVGGLSGLVVIVGIVWICRRRRAKNGAASSEKLRSDRSGFSTIISEPIVQPNSYRTEFILRPPSTPPRTDRQSIPCISEDRITRRSIRNPFNSPSPSDAGTNSRIPSFCEDSPPRQGQVGARLAPIRTMKASSQYLKPQRTSIHRQPSGECINVFADSNAVDDQFNRQTTFTELMDRADLKGVGRDKPYVPGTTPRI